MLDYRLQKIRASFPVCSANPYSFPNPNPYQPTNLAFSQTSHQQQLQFYYLQSNHGHSSNINSFQPHQLPHVGHPHRQIHQVLGT